MASSMLGEGGLNILCLQCRPKEFAVALISENLFISEGLNFYAQ